MEQGHTRQAHVPRQKHFLVSSLNDTRSRKYYLLLHCSRAETLVKVEIHIPDQLRRNLLELGTIHCSLLKSRNRDSQMLCGESLFVANISDNVFKNNILVSLVIPVK